MRATLTKRTCSVCSRTDMRDTGKRIVCTGCGSEFVDLNGELCLAARGNPDLVSHGSGRRLLKRYRDEGR